MEIEQEKIVGKLFDTIPLLNNDHLDVIIQTMDENQSKIFLIHAVKYAFHMGVFSLAESEVISKSIRILNSTNQKNME